MSISSTFKVGDRVVYPSHGVGEIVGQEAQSIGGVELKVFVINFPKDKMVLRVPVKRAEASGLRQLSTKEDMAKVMSILQGRAKISRGMWSRRAQEYEYKINSGNVLYLAEVVRDLHKNVDDPDRSYSERIIYESALGRLAAELAAVEKMESVDATDKLVYILKEKCAA